MDFAEMSLKETAAVTKLQGRQSWTRKRTPHCQRENKTARRKPPPEMFY